MTKGKQHDKKLLVFVNKKKGKFEAVEGVIFSDSKIITALKLQRRS